MDRIAKCLVLDDERSESIWRDHVKMPEKFWKQEQHHDLHLTGEQALEFGIATELGEFAPPPGMQIYRV
jgi:ATP-dependent Clp protease, protease subunit